MKFPRFFYPEQITVGQSIELPAKAMHHAVNVLRLHKGNKITLFNGNGGEFLASINHVSKIAVSVFIEKFIHVEHESPLQITLVQSICTNIKMDLIIRKSVELGVNNIQPVVAKRCLIKLSDKRMLKRISHWQQIVISACEQCGRNKVPPVFSPATLHEWLSRQEFRKEKLSNEDKVDLYLLLSPIAEKGLHYFSKDSSVVTDLTLLVGPEGGFISEEITAALMAGFFPIRLGSRILRTESAALAAIAALQTIWGDY